MEDKLLKKFMRSYKFTRLQKSEQMIELQDYKYQKQNFKPFKSDI